MEGRLRKQSACECEACVQVPHQYCLEKGTQCMTLRPVCVQTHTRGMCAARKPERLCAKLGAGKGDVGEERGLSSQPSRSTTLGDGVARPASLTLLSPLLPLCLFVSAFFFLFLPLSPVSQL